MQLGAGLPPAPAVAGHLLTAHSPCGGSPCVGDPAPPPAPPYYVWVPARLAVCFIIPIVVVAVAVQQNVRGGEGGGGRGGCGPRPLPSGQALSVGWWLPGGGAGGH